MVVPSSPERVPLAAPAFGPVACVALVRFALPLASAALVPVGYTSDELYYLACASHLDWGYVDHPPLSVALLSSLRFGFGDSILALRLLPALCEALAVLVTAALARELGGGRRAQLVAALAAASAPMALAIGLPYSMNPIEHLLWPSAALLLARLQNGADPKGWLLLGLVLGLALLNKLSTLWLGAGLAVGLVLSPARAWLATRWPWLAAGLAAMIFAPHVAWQVTHGWPTLEFIRNNATGREGLDAAVVMRSPLAFTTSQLLVMGPLAAPLWLLGLVYLLRSAGAEPRAGLPPVIGTHNSFWLWGTRGLDGRVLVVVADADSPLLAHFGSCRLMARVDCPYCGPELRERPIFVCRGPDRPLEALWAVLRQFV